MLCRAAAGDTTWCVSSASPVSAAPLVWPPLGRVRSVSAAGPPLTAPGRVRSVSAARPPLTAFGSVRRFSTRSAAAVAVSASPGYTNAGPPPPLSPAVCAPPVAAASPATLRRVPAPYSFGLGLMIAGFGPRSTDVGRPARVPSPLTGRITDALFLLVGRPVTSARVLSPLVGRPAASARVPPPLTGRVTDSLARAPLRLRITVDVPGSFSTATCGESRACGDERAPPPHARADDATTLMTAADDAFERDPLRRGGVVINRVKNASVVL